MGAKYFQELCAIFFDMSSASGYMDAKHVQEFGPRFLACHQKYMPVLCQEYMLFFCLPLSIQPRLNTQQQGHAWGSVGVATAGARAPVGVC